MKHVSWPSRLARNVKTTLRVWAGNDTTGFLAAYTHLSEGVYSIEALTHSLPRCQYVHFGVAWHGQISCQPARLKSRIHPEDAPASNDVTWSLTLAHSAQLFQIGPCQTSSAAARPVPQRCQPVLYRDSLSSKLRKDPAKDPEDCEDCGVSAHIVSCTHN